jgi:hypothetical protein
MASLALLNCVVSGRGTCEVRTGRRDRCECCLRRATAGIATTLIGRQAGLFLVAESGGLTAVLVYWPAPTGGTAAMLALGLSYAVTINSVSTQSGRYTLPNARRYTPADESP